MLLHDLLYTSMLSPGMVVVEEFYPDQRPKRVRIIELVEELTEGYYRITFADRGVTRAQGDERWMRA